VQGATQLLQATSASCRVCTTLWWHLRAYKYHFTEASLYRDWKNFDEAGFREKLLTKNWDQVLDFNNVDNSY